MTAAKNRKGGGAKTTRSETITVRVEPKIRYLAEIAGRKQRRTLSSFIEWAVEESLGLVILDDRIDQEDGHMFPASVADLTDEVWHVDDAERFARLAINFPGLLTSEEEERWQFIKECGFLNSARSVRADGKVDWNWTALDSVVFPALSKNWTAIITAFVDGEESRVALRDVCLKTKIDKLRL